MDDHELQKVTAGFPSGWYERQDKEGKIVLSKTKVDTGDLSGILQKFYGNRIKRNILKLRIEIDNDPVPPELIDQFYVFLSEHGYMCSQKYATDAMLWVAQKKN